MQAALVWSLIRELDPTGPNKDQRSHMPQLRPGAAKLNKQTWGLNHWLWGKPAADHKILKQPCGWGTEASHQLPALTRQAYVWATLEADPSPSQAFKCWYLLRMITFVS